MFPYTHICFAKDILGDLNSEIVLGAIFPDTVIAGYLDHFDTHGRCGALHSYLTGIGIFNNFADAAITHGTAPRGLDYYCDEKYLNFEKGYAFEQARPLVNDVIKCCHIPEKMGWWKAHNFIEMAADLWLFERRKDCHGYLTKALDNQDLILALSQVLAPFYDISTAKLAMGFPIYGEFVLVDEMTAAKFAEIYGKQMSKKHGISIDVAGTADVIEKARAIVGKTFPEFLQSCNQEVSSLVSTLSDRKQIL